MLLVGMRSRVALTLSASILALSITAPSFAQTKPAAAAPADCPPGTALSATNTCDPLLAATGKTSGNSADTEIVVTGSRIARNGTDSVAPVLVLDSKAIESRGFSTLGQALSEQPAFGIADSSPVGGQSSFGPGQSFVNFFGLGSQRTLTIVNGRRFVGSNTSTIFGPTGSGGSQVDLNLIPTKLIDRVETVAVGGAPIYGSDAIAGTINVILKRNYQGLDLDAQYGIADRGDASDYRFRILAGTNFASGRGNITFAGEYNDSTGLLATDRSLTGLGRYYDARTTAGYPYARELYTNRTLPGINESGIPIVGRIGWDFLGLNAILAPRYQTAFAPYLGLPAGTPFNLGVTGGISPTSALRFDTSGNLIPTDFGKSTGVLNSSGGNGYNLTNLSNLLTNTKRYSGILEGNYQITDGVHAFFEAWYTHSEGTNLRDQPEYNSGFFAAPGDLSNAGAYQINLANPFLSTAARTSIQQSIVSNPLSDQNQGYATTQNYFYLDRANTDLVTGRVKGKVDTYRAVVGLDGNFTVLSNKPWKWEVSANYGRSETSSVQPLLNTQNLGNAVDAVGSSAATAACRAGVVSSKAPTISNVCAPLNLFGSGVASQAARDYVTMLATPQSRNEEYDFVASLSGELFKMPGGKLSFAAGYEHRDEHTRFDPSAAFAGYFDTATQTQKGYGQSVPIAGINAGYNTDEVFGELEGDLIGPDNNIPLFRSLSFQLAGRYVNNSFNGNAFTWTAGGRWQPVKDFTFRGNFTHSIRSPSITEFANPAQSFFGAANDPCDPTQISQGPNASVRTRNCQAAFTALGVNLANYNSLSADRTFRQAVAGDVTLRNETADSVSVGGIFQPTFIPRLTVAADYIDIRVKGVITRFGADDTLSACYDSTTYPNNIYCGRITRDNTGQLSYIVQGYLNADQLRYRGIVGQGQYSVPTRFLGAKSLVSLGVSYQHLFELSSTSAGTKTRTEGTAGYSKDKGVATLSYSNGGAEIFAQASYLGPAKIDNYYAANYQINHYNAVVFTNLGATYRLSDSSFSIRLNVDNVFDQAPPFPSTGASDVYFRGTLGRYYRVGVTTHF